MAVTVEYTAQIKAAAGLAREQVDLPAACTVAELIAQVAHRHGSPLKDLLLDPQGNVQSTLMVFVDDEFVYADSARQVADQETITLQSPISGG